MFLLNVSSTLLEDKFYPLQVKHISYVRMCFPKRCRFGLNTGIDFAHFGVESRMVECMKIFVLSLPDE